MPFLNTKLWMQKEDAMATEKLAQDIHSFASDLEQLRTWLAKQFQSELTYLLILLNTETVR